MNSKEFFAALEALESEKNIKKEYFIEALEAGLTAAYKKMYGEAKSAIVKLNPEKNTIKVYSYKTIVEEVVDPDKEITLEEARQIKKVYKIGDIVEKEENTKEFGRIPSQTVKQVIMQKLRELTREQEYSLLSDKEGTLISAVIMREEGGNYYLNMGGMEAEGVLMQKQTIPGEKFVIGSRIKVYVNKILDLGRGAQIQVSRTNPNFVKRLFELEVPELQNGEIEIISVSREPGYRSKIAVKANNSDCDPIGACVGNKGLRVASIVSELNGEKIDIVPYSEDPAEYIANALSPAKVISVTVNENDKSSIAIVPDDKLSLAIGKSGQNVRLAARLTKWKIDVKSESQANKDKTVTEKLNELNEEDLFGDIDE